MRAVILASAIIGGMYTPALAGPREEAEARAALELALALQRQGKQAPVPVVKKDETKPRKHVCHEDIDVARSEAAKSGKQLVVLVGMQCDDMPEIRSAMDGRATFCHAESFNGSSARRVCVPVGDRVYAFPEESIKAGAYDASDMLRIMPKLGGCKNCENGQCKPGEPCHGCPNCPQGTAARKAAAPVKRVDWRVSAPVVLTGRECGA